MIVHIVSWILQGTAGVLIALAFLTVIGHVSRKTRERRQRKAR